MFTNDRIRFNFFILKFYSFLIFTINNAHKHFTQRAQMRSHWPSLSAMTRSRGSRSSECYAPTRSVGFDLRVNQVEEKSVALSFGLDIEVHLEVRAYIKMLRQGSAWLRR